MDARTPPSTTAVDLVVQAIREDRHPGYTHFKFKARVIIPPVRLRVLA